MVRIGAHDREGDPLAVVHATGADIVQFFLGDPQGWDAPTFPGGDAAALRDALAAAGVDAYIHAPYGINVASANNQIRIPSRKLLAQQLGPRRPSGRKASWCTAVTSPAAWPTRSATTTGARRWS